MNLPDGRKLGWYECGRYDGNPVLYFHGWPGSRLETIFFDSFARAKGIRLISVDRPGMGLSDFQPGRRIIDWPGDVERLINHLDLNQCHVLGVSGGSPYAVSCASVLANRIRSVGIISGIAPLEPKLESGLSWWNRGLLLISRRSKPLARLIFHLGARLFLCAPGLFVSLGSRSLSTSDREILARPELNRLFPELVREAFRGGIEGPSLDGELYAETWGIDMDSIQLPVLLWHGDADRIVSPANSEFLQKMIPKARLEIISREGHISLIFNHFPNILDSLLES